MYFAQIMRQAIDNAFNEFLKRRSSDIRFLQSIARIFRKYFEQ